MLPEAGLCLDSFGPTAGTVGSSTRPSLSPTDTRLRRLGSMGPERGRLWSFSPNLTTYLAFGALQVTFWKILPVFLVLSFPNLARLAFFIIRPHLRRSFHRPYSVSGFRFFAEVRGCDLTRVVTSEFSTRGGLLVHSLDLPGGS